jgi:hypothetical protein
VIVAVAPAAVPADCVTPPVGVTGPLVAAGAAPEGPGIAVLGWPPEHAASGNLGKGNANDRLMTGPLAILRKKGER